MTVIGTIAVGILIALSVIWLLGALAIIQFVVISVALEFTAQ
jgi:hypothetical protein